MEQGKPVLKIWQYLDHGGDNITIILKLELSLTFVERARSESLSELTLTMVEMASVLILCCL